MLRVWARLIADTVRVGDRVWDRVRGRVRVGDRVRVRVMACARG